MPGKTKLAAVAATVAVLLPLSACGGNPTTAGSSGGSSTITIGSANFPENELLAEISRRLQTRDQELQARPRLFLVRTEAAGHKV